MHKLFGKSYRLYPDVIVVESAAANRCRLVCTNQRIDSASAFKAAIWPYTFRDHNATPDLVVSAQMKSHDAQFISHGNLLAICKTIRLYVSRMHQYFRSTFPL